MSGQKQSQSNRRRGRNAAPRKIRPQEEADNSKMVRRDRNPPEIRAAVPTTKRIRILPVANASFVASPSLIATFFPGGTAVPDPYLAFRIKRIEAWSSDSIAGSTSTSSPSIGVFLAGIQSTGLGNSFQIGDQQTYTDDGTFASSRAHVDVIPSREFAAHWWSVGDTVSTCFTVSSSPLGTATELLTLDLVVEMSMSV